MDDWRMWTATALGRGIGAGRIDPVALTEAFLEAIDGHADADRIYARTTPDRARAEAAAARDRAARCARRGPLDGVPVSWKDLYDSAGVATESGTPLLAGRTPDRDAAVLARATAAGLVCLGKTHMTELAFSGLGLNPKTASPPNRHDPGVASGGSSSGAAASLAFGLAAAAVGSDTGGSVRLPAAWNDLVGLHPGHGTLPLEGVVPLAPSFDTVGPLARSVEDAAAMLAALGGPRVDLAGARIDGARLGVLETSAMEDVRDAPRAATEAAVERLAAAGARIERITVPEVADAMTLAPRLFAPEAYGIWGDVIEADPEAMSPAVRERFRGGREVGAPAYVAAHRALERHRRAFAARVAGFDAVLQPTCPITPPDRERLLADPDYFASENLMTLRNTRIGNLMGLAGVTLPTGTPACGLLVQTSPGRLGHLLRLARSAEAALA